MFLKPEKFTEAIQIISKSKSVKVSFNVPIEDNYSSVYEILIHESSAGLINKLIEKGFSLSMTKKGLTIDHYNS